jgi:uncharacterized membrane-anchored protein
MTDFWSRFNEFAAEAKTTKVGKIMTSNNYEVAHTGGGCMCWERIIDDSHYLWICDLMNGLGESPNEEYLVGCYDSEGNFDNASVSNLKAALKWCDERHSDPDRYIAEYSGNYSRIRSKS